MQKLDFQIHSLYSDGKYSPKELVEKAKNLGMETISLTDHDTVLGLKEAVLSGKELRIRVIPGIELSAEHEKEEIHILGYGIEFTDKKFEKLLSGFEADRIGRAKEIIKRLQKQGFDIKYEDVLNQTKGKIIARPHIALAVLEKEYNQKKIGKKNTAHEFIENYLVSGKKTYVERKLFSAAKAISFIHETGGVAIWSHPAIHYNKDYNLLEIHLKLLIRSGLDGVEAFHPAQSEDETELLLSLSRQYNIIFTAGSDFHREEGYRGAPPGQRSAQNVGDFETFGYSLEEIIPNLKKTSEKHGGEILKD